MSIECYDQTCPKHNKTEPFCHEETCIKSVSYSQEWKWISVKDRLPEIPEGYYAVPVIVAEYDKCYAEIVGDKQKGYSVHQAQWTRPHPKTGYEDYWFCGLVYGKDIEPYWDYLVDEVTHWMYKPEPPIYGE